MRFGPLDNATIATWLGIGTILAVLLFMAWYFGQ
jgi:hypothetical protein